MVESLPITFGNATVVLSADRAAYLPAARALLIADLHLGKGETFRRHGLSVPTGGTRADLDRLRALVRQFPTDTLYVLGDVLHGAVLDAATLEAWAAFLQAVAPTQVVLIAGNHDFAIARHDLGVPVMREDIEVSGLHLRHAPAEGPLPLPAPVVCGHIHPVVRIPGENRRFPAFWLKGDHLVLPAFSLFTGGSLVRPAPGERVVVVNGTQLVEIPS